jgi:hypothetical protein
MPLYLSPPQPSSPPLQEWECLYLLTKARRLRDAAIALRHSQASSSTGMGSTDPPEYVASRVEDDEELPEVEVRALQAEGWLKRGAVEEGKLVREAVVRHVVEGLRGELMVELVGMMDM